MRMSSRSPMGRHCGGSGRNDPGAARVDARCATAAPGTAADAVADRRRLRDRRGAGRLSGLHDRLAGEPWRNAYRGWHGDGDARPGTPAAPAPVRAVPRPGLVVQAGRAGRGAKATEDHHLTGRRVIRGGGATRDRRRGAGMCPRPDPGPCPGLPITREQDIAVRRRIADERQRPASADRSCTWRPASKPCRSRCSRSRCSTPAAWSGRP